MICEGLEVRRGKGETEDGGENERLVVQVGCCRSWDMSHHIWFTMKTNRKLRHISNILDFEIEIFWPKTYPDFQAEKLVEIAETGLCLVFNF